MRIALFHTDTIRSSWHCWAAARILRRMGHTVLDARIPCDRNGAVRFTVSRTFADGVLAGWPTLEQLGECDAVIVLGPEYVQPWIAMAYNRHRAKVPYLAISLESGARSPAHATRYAELRPLYDVWGWGSPADVEAFGGFLQRPGVDCEMFTPDFKGDAVGFCGTLYERRALFLAELQQHLGDVDFAVGEPVAMDLAGERQKQWTELYVQSLNSLAIHVDLPGNNPFPSARAFESLACGTFLLSPVRLPKPLSDGVDYILYDGAEECATLIRHWLAHPEGRREMAAAGCDVVRQHFTSELAWERILEHVPGVAP